ncbi:hypothetical protein DW355_00430 [Hylemonella gracilis]|uniref:Uncharacterized protein n=1 Tax=Hylemonella gracilis TaxID=80880 RepID=A0A4P6UE63_9BURK|nr:hypothetical protein DW355_00430 [Hylemonella gracilis]
MVFGRIPRQIRGRRRFKRNDIGDGDSDHAIRWRTNVLEGDGPIGHKTVPASLGGKTGLSTRDR